MNRDNQTKLARVRRQSSACLFAVSAALLALTGCNSLVDPPAAMKAPEQNVKNYYVLLEQPKMQYRYALTSKNAFQPASDVLLMDMQGVDTNETWSGAQVYICNWSYVTAGKPTLWYYALDETKAVGLGIESAGKYTDSWVDLQSPLQQDASWTFTSHGELVTAKVTHFGITAAVAGKSFNDVIVVDYSGAAGTKGTCWFARGTGTIFTHIERPGDVMLDAQYQSMAQK